ncbi:MAG TPA: acyloxyacyl hydrolase [Gemmatimonadaceae bacterium]
MTATTGLQEAAHLGARDTADLDIPETAPADSVTPDERHWPSSASFFGVRLATAHHSRIPNRISTPMYRDLYIVDLRAGWTMLARGPLSVEYVPSVVPLVISTGNPEYVQSAGECPPEDDGCVVLYEGGPEFVPRYHTAYGFGLSPVGFQLRLFRQSPVQILAHASGGALWFSRPVPDPEATRFNFTAELGSALQIRLPDHFGLVLGYTWHHTSNAGTGHVNPGLNSRVLTFGLVVRSSEQEGHR